MKDDRLYIHHILNCIDRIERYCRDGEQAFLATELLHDAALRKLQTLAESTKRMSDDLKALHPEVDWRAVAAFRNLLVHEYLGVDP